MKQAAIMLFMSFETASERRTHGNRTMTNTLSLLASIMKTNLIVFSWLLTHVSSNPVTTLTNADCALNLNLGDGRLYLLEEDLVCYTNQQMFHPFHGKVLLSISDGATLDCQGHSIKAILDPISNWHGDTFRKIVIDSGTIRNCNLDDSFGDDVTANG